MAEYRLILDNISKSYGNNPVLKNVTIKIKPGEVLSLVGENGAGKSTLMNILFGMDVIKATGGFIGDIYIDGEKVEIDSPSAALHMGIGMVHQEFMLIDEYSIAENIKLNKENTKHGLTTRLFHGKLDLVDMKAMGESAKRTLDMVHLPIDEWTIVNGLSVGIKQFIEIAKVLDSTNNKLIIFDEPTATLSETESSVLLGIIKELAAKGISCIFISHKLDEVLDVSDKVVVLRDGEVVSVYKKGETDAKELAHRMVGRELGDEIIEKRDLSGNSILMSIRGLEVDMPGERVKGADLDIRQGEILGIGGLAGAGKLGISNGIHGLYPSRGNVTYKGQELNIKRTRDVLVHRIAFLSEDRKGVGLLLDESIEMNCIISSLVTQNRFTKKIAGVRVIDKKAAKEETQKIIKQLDIRCTDLSQRVGSLSGGNQQKVCIAAMLLQEPEMIFVSEPSRGIDIGAKKIILDYLKELNRERGVTIVVTSSELHELRGICDRIAIVAEGRVAGILEADEPSEKFGLLMANIADSEPA